MYLGASRTCPLYIFDSDMEAHVNMRRGVTVGLDREIVVKIQRVVILVEMFLRTGVFIRSFQSLICKPWELISHV